MSRVYVYDPDLDREVEFESRKPHCTSCEEDEEYDYYGACCCNHHEEYKNLMENNNVTN